MARSRNIKPGFFRNEVLAEMSIHSRLLFIGLWTLADREGRLEDRPKRIRAELFPFDYELDLDGYLNELEKGGFVVRYEVDGVRFVQVENFVKHQDPHYKEKASEIAPPPGRDNLIAATGVTRTQRARILERDGFVCLACGAKEHLCIDHILPVSRGGDSSDENLQTLCMPCNTKKGNKLDGESKNSYQRRSDFDSMMAERKRASPSEPLIPDSLNPDSLIPDVESASLKPKPLRKRDKTALPLDFYPDATGLAKANDSSVVVATEMPKFRDHHLANGSLKSDWQAAWRTWVSKAVEFRKPGDNRFVTVPGRQEPDPELARIKAHRGSAAPPEIQARINAIIKPIGAH